MKTINRFALIVRPDPPFFEWAAKAFDTPVAKMREELSGLEPSICLLPESSAPDVNHPTLLKSHWRAIFKEELEACCTDEDLWPRHRSEALFRAWFKLELATIVSDCSKIAIQHDNWS